MSKHPRTEVSFAPTKVFVEKYGAAEGERQRVKYERPSWAQQPVTAPVETCETAHAPPQKLTADNPEVLLFGVSFAMGIVTGAFVVWLFYQ